MKMQGRGCPDKIVNFTLSTIHQFEENFKAFLQISGDSPPIASTKIYIFLILCNCDLNK